MSAYQNFLDFFSMHNKERLDGLSETYFAGMTQQERTMAFNYLLKMVRAGGSEESVNGLFLADSKQARPIVSELLQNEILRDEAKIAAAWNLFRSHPDASLIPIFVDLMSSADKRIRAKAAYYVPCGIVVPELISGLQGMIRTETDTLASINATNKILECYGITRDSVGKEEFSRLYRGLRSDELKDKERAFSHLKLLYNSKNLS
jgi:hypothetical protein